MILDRWVVAVLAPLAIWVLLNGLDDLVIDLACLYRWLRRKTQYVPSDEELAIVPERRMAIFVPLWKEYRVIQNMVEHNVAAQKYKSYDFFIGAYPNDSPTLAAVKEVVKRFPNAHMAVCPHGGPTSKADCLNWIYQRMLVYEEEHGVRFEMVLTHDAEDLVHPEALRWINYYAQWYDMVQIPVLALPTPVRELTHGVYCDEFAEYQFKDMPTRALMGGFLPSNGVGTGFSRRALERLAEAHSNCIFEPRCLTEDYENGFRIFHLGLPQIFIPITRRNGTFVATREYFPRLFSKAVRQRTRWVTGIALQSWEMHAWKDTAGQLYWFWRDRKGLLTNLTTPVGNLLFAYGIASWLWTSVAAQPWGLALADHQPWLLPVCLLTLSLQAMHMGMRSWCSAQIYGWKFAAWVPVRALWGNWISFLATSSAIQRYTWAKIQGRPLVWLKTEHAYPNRAALEEHRKKIGEILVGSSYLSQEDLDWGLQTQPAGVLIGDWLVKNGRLTLESHYEALALQANVPLGLPLYEEISKPVTRILPASMSRSFQILPFRVVAGHLYVAGTEFPDEAKTRRIQQFCGLELRFHLVTPIEFEVLADEYLPAMR